MRGYELQAALGEHFEKQKRTAAPSEHTTLDDYLNDRYVPKQKEADHATDND